MTNREVIRHWNKGVKARAGSLRTDGKKLWSYNLQIGFTGEDGYKYVWNYTAHKDTAWNGFEVRGDFVSMTTSKHIGMARCYGYAVESGSCNEVHS